MPTTPPLQVRSIEIEEATELTVTPLLSPSILLDHSHLKPGHHAALLSYSQTLTMYRENAKKTNSPDIQCDFAIFMVEAVKPLEDTDLTRRDCLAEAEKLLKQLATQGHVESQYYLANLYGLGIIHKKHKSDPDKAFSLFLQASKHHHADASYRTAKCYEEGLGSRKDNGKAIQFYRKAAALGHPGAMYRLGLVEMKGELGMTRNPRDGVKWLKRSAEAATTEFPHALYELALLHEKGVPNIAFVDPVYAVSLYQQAADLGHLPSIHRLGVCYEHGRLGCQQNSALSIHYYTTAAQQGYAEACFALTAWYLIGCPGILPPSDRDAYMWALSAAEKELPKAEYTDANEATKWYTLAASHGDPRAYKKLHGDTKRKDVKKKRSQEDCSIM
ncbi:hypothetical protein BDF14DRAFT_1952448 [Spinellus fusiger]|nr:hypothetical protein BDF14DRAFT_1952448 [Spinellus fusiger]